MTFEETKEILKKSIDTTNTMNQAIENVIQSIYSKGYNDAKREIALSGEYERAYERGKADAQPKTGHWIRFKNKENGYYHIKCSECGQYWSIDGHAKIFKRCFNCGAEMQEVQE